MAKDQFVAFDLNADSGRTFLATLDSDRLAIEERHRFPTLYGRLNGTLQWNLLQIWEEIKNGLRRCAFEGPGKRRDIAGLAVTGWAYDFGLVAANGDVLGNPVHFRDRGGEIAMEAVSRRMNRQRIFDTTGIAFSPSNTLYQLAALREAKSPLLAAAESLLFIPDLFHFMFTGKRQSEMTIASTSGMYNPRKRAWADDLLHDLELPRKLLPNVAPPCSVIGPMRKEIMDECRVGAIQVIMPASHEGASAVAALPASGESWCYILSGMSSVIGVDLGSPMISEKVLASGFSNEAAIGGRTRLSRSIPGLWLVQECRRQFASEGREYGYDELIQLAAKAEPMRTIIDPDHRPFLEPGDIPRKIDRFAAATNQRPPSEPGEFVRTCLESLALRYRKMVDQLEDLADKRIKTIHIAGPGAANELLNQMTADACARPVIAGPIEPTAIGNVLAQALSLGRIRSIEDGRKIVRSSFDVRRFDPRDTKVWDTAWERYIDIRQQK